MTGSAALSYQNIKVIAGTPPPSRASKPSRSASVEDGSPRSSITNQSPGGSGYISYQDNHQAAWGSTDSQSALGYQVLDQELNLVWPSENATTGIDTQSTDQECGHTIGSGDNGPFRPNRNSIRDYRTGGEMRITPVSSADERAAVFPVLQQPATTSTESHLRSGMSRWPRRATSCSQVT